MTDTAIARPALTRDHVMADLTRASRLDAIAYALAAPEVITERLSHGRHPESLLRWQARAVEAVLRHREDALGREVLSA